MSKTFIVLSSMNDWSAYASSEYVCDLETYLSINFESDNGIKVINLIGDYKYQTKGYYCTLLAEARGHKVTPSLETLGAYNQPVEFRDIIPFPACLTSSRQNPLEKTIELLIVFGMTNKRGFEIYAKFLFNWMNFPIIKAKFTNQYHNRWIVESFEPLSLKMLSPEEEDFFVSSLEKYYSKVWRKQPHKKANRYDLAILYNPEEKFPPSNKKSLYQFISVAKSLGLNTELITAKEFKRLPEFDALFIRETTAVNHHTYSFAREAQRLGMIVIDDPTSILRCTNKVYLNDLLNKHGICVPDNLLLSADSTSNEIFEDMQYPQVLKIPDGSFSRGVIKVNNKEEMKRNLDSIFSLSHLVISQKYIYTEFDWRIGILNRVPIFACQYHMAKGHWQIYSHNDDKVKIGNAIPVPVNEVPNHVLKTALKAASLIGNGLYGVDLKQVEDKCYVIEVNDNPNIDYRIEDKIQGSDLYKIIIQEFLRRLYSSYNEKSGNIKCL